MRALSSTGLSAPMRVTRQPGHKAFMILTDGIVKQYRRNGVDFGSGVFSGDFTKNFEENFTSTEKDMPDQLFSAGQH